MCLVTYAVNIYGKICHMQSTVPRPLCVCLVAQSFLTLLWPHGLWPTRFLCLWDFSGKNTRMGCHCLLRGSWPRYGSCVSCVASRFFTHWAIREALLGTLEDSKRNWMLLYPYKIYTIYCFFILTALWDRYHYYLHSTDEKMKAQKD